MILGRKWFHSPDCAAGAVRTLILDKNKQKKLNDRSVARVIADLKPHREWDEAVASQPPDQRSWHAPSEFLNLGVRSWIFCRMPLRNRGPAVNAEHTLT